MSSETMRLTNDLISKVVLYSLSLSQLTAIIDSISSFNKNRLLAIELRRKYSLKHLGENSVIMNTMVPAIILKERLCNTIFIAEAMSGDTQEGI